MRNAKRPNFFIVGEPKSATTALYVMLKEHKDIFMPEEKEPQYFCRDFIEESDEFHGKKFFYPYRTEKQYLDLFSDAHDQQCIGEGSTDYLYSKSAAEGIHSFCPDAKIIVMLREPTEFMYSLHSQFLKMFFEDERDFLTALEIEEKRKKGECIPSRAKAASLLFYRTRCDYQAHIERYVDAFGPNNVKVLVMEDFWVHTEDRVREVFRFLGVDERLAVEKRVVNENHEVKNSFFYRQVVHNLYVKSFAQKVLPVKLERYLKNKLFDMFYVAKKRSKLDEGVRANLKKSFVVQVGELQRYLREKELIAEDLDIVKIWGYGNR